MGIHYHFNISIYFFFSIFSLLVRQYDSVGELIRALEKTYVINFKTKEDVAQMWVGLSQIRSLLPVQMSQEEEELMRERLWFVMVFFDEYYSLIIILNIRFVRYVIFNI